MVHEAYVSFEIAKLLKEKGFDWRTQYVYTLDGTGSTPHKIGNWRAKSDIQKPTHQMAMAWLREVLNIFIEISTSIDLNGDYNFSYTILDKECKYVRRGYTSFDWNYEDAVEAALKYTLENLI